MHMQGGNGNMNDVLTVVLSVKHCCRLHDGIDAVIFDAMVKNPNMYLW